MRYILALCFGYWCMYTVFGAVVRYYIKIAKMPGMEFLFHSTLWAMAVVLGVVLVLGWPARLSKSGSKFPLFDHSWIIWSGICTGFVIPTTSLMYTFGFSVAVAMIIMRNMLIIASPVVDGVLIAQGYSNKRVRWQEYAAVLTSVCAMVITIFGEGTGKGNYEFFKSTAVLTTMAAYFLPYCLRLYIMSRYKTRLDQKGFMAVEQCWAVIAVLVVSVLVLAAHKLGGWNAKQVVEFARGMDNFPSMGAMLWSTPYAIIAFVSVFLYLYRYGSATFNTTVNRLTSLIAGTTSTLVFGWFFGGKGIKPHEWVALGVTCVALSLLYWAGKVDEAERSSMAKAGT